MPHHLTNITELPFPHNGYRELFTNDAISERRRSCDVDAGDWTMVLLTSFLESFEANADTTAISHAAGSHATWPPHCGRAV
jgi:hypothetical protein